MEAPIGCPDVDSRKKGNPALMRLKDLTLPTRPCTVLALVGRRGGYPDQGWQLAMCGALARCSSRTGTAVPRETRSTDADSNCQELSHFHPFLLMSPLSPPNSRSCAGGSHA